MEVITGSQDIIICLDSSFAWEKESFEQAVIAAASLYFYASKSQMNVQLWTAKTGIVAGNRVVLETLAGVETEESLVSATLPDTPLIWLTQNLATLESLHAYSRWLFFSHPQTSSPPMREESLGIVINLNESLAPQLQQPLK